MPALLPQSTDYADSSYDEHISSTEIETEISGDELESEIQEIGKSLSSLLMFLLIMLIPLTDSDTEPEVSQVSRVFSTGISRNIQH